MDVILDKCQLKKKGFLNLSNIRVVGTYWNC